VDVSTSGDSLAGGNSSRCDQRRTVRRALPELPENNPGCVSTESALVLFWLHNIGMRACLGRDPTASQDPQDNNSRIRQAGEM